MEVVDGNDDRPRGNALRSWEGGGREGERERGRGGKREREGEEREDVGT